MRFPFLRGLRQQKGGLSETVIPLKRSRRAELLVSVMVLCSYVVHTL